MLEKDGPIVWLVFFTILIGVWTYLTNPFVSKRSLFKNPYKAIIDKNTISIEKIYSVRIRRGWHHKLFAYIHCAWQIVYYRLKRPRKTKAETIDGIIAEILHERFNPRRPYLISGDHFVEHYPRNLGVFYYPAFDGSTAISEEDWNRRQQILLQSLYFDLAVFTKAKTLSTTVVPMSRHSVSLVNIYAYPSDTLYSVLYALYALSTDNILSKLYSYKSSSEYSSLTKEAARQALNEYRDKLSEVINHYIEKIVDYRTGLLKKDLLLSGTKDITRRSQAFYDNVVFWRTLELAELLKIPYANTIDSTALKERILKSFWDKTDGIFHEDLAAEKDQKDDYSSDWLVVLFTGFLNPVKKSEREYCEKVIRYIKINKIDEPFPLKYHAENRGHRQYHLVRMFLPEYGGSAIWSFWGMEYCKLLVLMYQSTGAKTYLEDAIKHFNSYTKNIEKFRGFPEVYDDKGELLRKGFYSSILRTGWVVNYLQVKKMLEEI